MPDPRNLLERLNAPSASLSNERQLQPDVQVTVEAVSRHLQDLFNTRRGSALTRRDYGLPDFNDLVFGTKKSVETELGNVIRETIQAFEPRLTAVRVRHIPDDDDPLSLRYEISGRLLLGADRAPVAFETIMTESGRIRVRA